MPFIYFLISLLIVIKGADLALNYSTKISHSLRISPYLIGFLIVAFFSILPEMFIFILSNLEGNSSFGLATIYGSNMADLTLIVAIVFLFSKNNIKIESKLIKDNSLYLIIALIPIIFGLNGHYSRIEGIVLILTFFLFYFFILKENKKNLSKVEIKEKTKSYKYFLLLPISIGIIILGSHFTIKNGIKLAEIFNLNPIIISMFLVGLGTTLPELSFSVKAARKNEDNLALGDILGTVITDLTFVIGVASIIKPFYFNPRIIYITATFMILSMAILFHFMKTGRIITKKETLFLFLLYLIFVITEFMVNSYF